MDLETFLDEDMTTGGSRGFGAVARRAFRALRKAKAHFAVIGAVALGIWAQKRTTEDIDLLTDSRKWRAAIRAMRQAGFKDHPDFKPDRILARFIDPKTGVGVDLLFGVGDPEESARTTAKKQRLFSEEVPVASAEYLVWLYLMSDRVQHHADAIALLRSGSVDLRKLREKLLIDGNREAMSRLKDWVADARRPENDWIEKRRERIRSLAEEE